MAPLEGAAQTFAIIGVGQLGSLFGGLLVKRGARVVAIRRGYAIDPSLAADRVIVAVGEDDLAPVLSSLPTAWRDRVVLVQNELSPDAWLAHGITHPTVASVFFEKKRDRAPRVVLPTRIAGPWATLLAAMLNDEGLTAIVIDERELPRALLDKNVYILTSNIAGLTAPSGTTTSALLEVPQLERTCRIFADVLRVESARSNVEVDADDASAAMMRAFRADPDHVAAGRSAPAKAC